ncbi:MAG: T9SS type A sorting domain-containing protein, partial [Bacteroidetes bacterium]|nr:T9SS type A sorting domain-containing protein [Bacteroidota bacterium]
RVSLIESESITLTGYKIMPYQTPSKDIKGGQPEGFDYDAEFYRAQGNYPETNLLMGQPGIWRDVKISGLIFVPFSYTPAKQELQVITKARLKVEFYGQDTENLPSGNKIVSPVFYKMYESKILNFSSLGFLKGNRNNDDIKYLIITNTNPLATIQPLVDWKNQQGFKVEVKTMEAGFNTPEDFKDYISQLYVSDGLEYVLMVGDAYPNGGNTGDPDDVPMYWWDPAGEDPSYSDSWYTCLDGPDDHYADLAIGRFTYDNLSELDLQIQKTIDHYRNPDASTNWAENTILVAHEEQYPQKYTQCKNEIETYPYTLQIPIFEECYGGAGASNDDIVNYINANSCGIFNYRGHGSATEFWEWCSYGSFTASHIAQFTNNDRLFVLFDVCCDNMDIVAHPGDCLCESFMKSPVASVAINGAIIPSYTIPNHDYDKEMYKAVFEEGIWNIGYVTNFANVTVLNVHGTIGRSNVRTYLWLGDASLEPWTLQPDNLTVTHDPYLFLGFDQYSVNVSGSNGPIEDARVCIMKSDMSLYAVAFTDASGDAVLQFGGPIVDPGEAILTVSYHNYLPYQVTLPIIPLDGSFLVLNDVDIDDATGNNNGYADFGEHVKLDVTIENIGNDSAINVIGKIFSSDTMITITDSIHEWGIIPGQSLSFGDSAFALSVSPAAPDQYIALINFEFEDDSEALFTDTYELLLSAPVLNILEMVIDDNTYGNGNGRLDPGESATLKIKNKNLGHCPAENSVGTLTTISQYITMSNTTCDLGTLGLLGYKWAEYEVVVDPDAPDGCVFADFDYQLNSGQFLEEKTFRRKIGLLLEDFETGNFTKWDWVQGGNSPWTIISQYPYEGVYSAKSGTITHSQTSQIQITLEIMTADTLYFIRKISSEPQDKLKFYINNVLTDDWAGAGEGWNQEKYYVGTGMKTFKWIYQKDNSGSGGSDCAWLDYIIFPPIMTLTCYAGQDNKICAGEDYQCQGEATDWISVEWTSSGSGTFDDPTLLNPLYTPSADDISTGSVVLTISAENAEGDIADDEMTLSIISAPQIPAMPEGPDYVDLFLVLTSEYTTGTVNGAQSYYWRLDPPEAGSISGYQTTGSVLWNEEFLGSAEVSVMAINDCGQSDYSDAFEVNVDNTVGMFENNNKETVRVYPNPNNGNFVVELNYPASGKADISIYNTVGTKILEENGISFTGMYIHSIDLKDQPEGLYFLQIVSGSEKFTKKIIVNK